MEAEAEEFPRSDLSQIFNSIKHDRDGINQIKKEFEALDPEISGLIDIDEATKKIVRLLKLQLHEAITIVRRFTVDNKFDYFQFINLLRH